MHMTSFDKLPRTRTALSEGESTVTMNLKIRPKPKLQLQGHLVKNLNTHFTIGQLSYTYSPTVTTELDIHIMIVPQNPSEWDWLLGKGCYQILHLQ